MSELDKMTDEQLQEQIADEVRKAIKEYEQEFIRAQSASRLELARSAQAITDLREYIAVKDETIGVLRYEIKEKAERMHDLAASHFASLGEKRHAEAELAEWKASPFSKFVEQELDKRDAAAGERPE